MSHIVRQPAWGDIDLDTDTGQMAGWVLHADQGRRTYD